MPIRVAAYVDGFNLYHAIDDLGKDHLKWVDLCRLIECFTDPAVHIIAGVYYFSAYATWLPAPYARHQAYVRALKLGGTTPVLGNFKEKPRSCLSCGASWTSHEEKESDVNLAVYMIQGAIDNVYDQAFLVTGDSDLAAPCRFIRERFPAKQIKLLAPPGRYHSKQLWGLAQKHGKILERHLESCLLPAAINPGGKVGSIVRPTKYNPPA